MPGLCLFAMLVLINTQTLWAQPSKRGKNPAATAVKKLTIWELSLLHTYMGTLYDYKMTTFAGIQNDIFFPFPLSFQISAQESRRKKKEFVDTLERQVEVASQELGEYKRKCLVLEKEKATLLVQLKSLRAMVVSSSSSSSSSAAASTPMMSSTEVKEEIKAEPMDRTDGKVSFIVHEVVQKCMCHSCFFFKHFNSEE